MAQQCPLLFRKVDATVIRINTLFVMTGIVAFLMTQYLPILMVLIVDFFLRLNGYKKLSPIENLSLIIQEKLSLPSKMEDAGAKRLAALFGVGFIIAIGVFSWFGLPVAVNITAAVYLICAVPDLLFNFCIACKIYYLAKKIYPNKEV